MVEYYEEIEKNIDKQFEESVASHKLPVKTVDTKREILIEVDERLTGAFTSALKPLLDTLFVDKKVRGYKIVDLAPINGVTLAQEGTLVE